MESDLHPQIMEDYQFDDEAYSKAIEIAQSIIANYGYDECKTENEKKWLDKLVWKLQREGI